VYPAPLRDKGFPIKGFSLRTLRLCVIKIFPYKIFFALFAASREMVFLYIFSSRETVS